MVGLRQWSWCVALVVGCSFDASGTSVGGGQESLSPSDTGATTAPGTGSSGAATSLATTTTATTAAATMTGNPTTATTMPATSDTGSQDTGEAGSSTGGPLELVDRGVVTRYFLDEAMSGQTRTFATDASGNAVDLQVAYDGNMMYANDGSNRGLSWQAAGGGGRALIGVFGTAVANRMDGTAQATLEVVARVDAVGISSSRLTHIGTGIDSDFSLATNDIQALLFRFNQNNLAASYPVDFVQLGRCVIHLVLDTNEGNAADRARLYVNGRRVDAISGPNVGQGELLTLSVDPFYVLGNRHDGVRSFEGMLFYAAMYDVALTPAEVRTNADVLGDSDDSP